MTDWVRTWQIWYCPKITKYKNEITKCKVVLSTLAIVTVSLKQHLPHTRPRYLANINQCLLPSKWSPMSSSTRFCRGFDFNSQAYVQYLQNRDRLNIGSKYNFLFFWGTSYFIISQAKSYKSRRIKINHY